MIEQATKPSKPVDLRRGSFLPHAAADWVVLGLTALYWIFSLLWSGRNERVVTVIEVGLMWMWLIYALLHTWSLNRPHPELCSYVGAICFLHFFIGGRHLNLQDGSGMRWIITLYEVILVAAVILIVYGICRKAARKKHAPPRKRKKGRLIGAVFVTIAMSLGILYLTPGYLNYALDTTPPIIVHATISDRERQGRAKAPDRYYLTVILDSRQVRLEVPRNIYRRCEVGDSVVIETYEGAFGWSYFVVDPSSATE